MNDAGLSFTGRALLSGAAIAAVSLIAPNLGAGEERAIVKSGKVDVATLMTVGLHRSSRRRRRARRATGRRLQGTDRKPGDDGGVIVESVAAYLKAKYGDLTAIQFGLWASMVLAIATVYAFFFKETASTYQKYYEYKLEKCADAAVTVARIANSDDDKELGAALIRFDELYYGHLVLFEGRQLARQMIAFRSIFATMDEDLLIATVKHKRMANRGRVRQEALKLASICRREISPTLLGLIYDRLFPVRQ